MTTEAPAAQAHVKSAPVDFFGILKQLGPGLIISSIIVGSGELIVTPKVGAAQGFSLLWFMVAACFIKVFVQIELVRFAVSKGLTTLEAMNLMPGPRIVVSWLLWLWLFMYVALIFQVAGMIGGLASVFKLAGVPVQDERVLAIITGSSCAILLVIGRYKLVEIVSTALVVIFTLTTLAAVGALHSTPYAITGAQMAEGFKFYLPNSFTTAFAAFGIIGVGASELIYYPYWCLEKGYAKSVGPHDHTALWVKRAKGWLRILKIDAWVSFVIYTTATIAFYLLGASILHAKGLVVEDKRMIETLSFMYRDTFGEWSYWAFLVGAFAVLYSTVFGATASNARLFADALALFRVRTYQGNADRLRMVKLGCVLLPVAFTGVYILVGEPVRLVFVGALAQGLMLPFLAYAALYFRAKHTHPELAKGRVWTFFLWVAAIAMTTVGLYQVVTKMASSLK